ncbi:citrate-Mg2+:H+ or citrate-Ca2+:H+ symporter, CitMHS family [Brevibacterium siliguriense]|uniref:Citrate-Mg2+:H+ or citrate-Ca2+:H+ symporter, CitMHS family n=1 Tax=Brevibacterium siliguriense TaxID=1136497 RepID=A0A1H1ND71_9MICO|nr:SLC13 family permease [Brevibacterium siliguriense]SDR96936.1 citrate-Mg2+:H+ or citrate-Ca2+:H+ symporter, CitMHS family [Brevibacterium siliguriense]
MLSLIGYVTMLVILALLLTQKVSPVVALAGVPLVAALIAGQSLTDISEFVSVGIAGVADVVVMFIFAIVFFGILRNAKFFDPIIDRIIRFGGSSPRTVAVATTLLACVVHLDGAGATTFLVAIPAMLPLYQRLGMSRLTLSTCVALGAGVMNMLPWGGPTARAAATIKVDANDLWVPLIPAQLVGIIAALAVAWYLGHREVMRLNRVPVADSANAAMADATLVAEIGNSAEASNRVRSSRGSEALTETGQPAGSDAPGGTDASGDSDDTRGAAEAGPTALSLTLNGLVLVAALAAMMTGVISPALTFMVATILALLINHRGLAEQSEQFDLNAKSCMLMASTLLAAGVLLGVLDESGMIEAMAKSATAILPAGIMPVLPIIVAVLGVPMSLLFGPDAYYFGLLPVLASVGSSYGIDPVVLGQASIIGQETLGFPISPLTGSFYLLVGLAGVPLSKHILRATGWLWLVSIVVTIVAIALGVIPLWVS